jgi:hypothetical protein
MFFPDVKFSLNSSILCHGANCVPSGAQARAIERRQGRQLPQGLIDYLMPYISLPKNFCQITRSMLLNENVTSQGMNAQQLLNLRAMMSSAVMRGTTLGMGE